MYTTSSQNNDFSVIGLLCLVMLALAVITKKVVAACEKYSRKYPRAATVFWFVLFFSLFCFASIGEYEAVNGLLR